MKKSTSQNFHKRLMQYGALSVAVAGVSNVNGQIIWTDVDPDFGGVGQGYALDLNNNADPDFYIYQKTSFGNYGDINGVRMFPLRYFVGPGNAVLANVVYANSSFSLAYPLVLNTNDTISAGNSAWNSNYQGENLAYDMCNVNSDWCGVTDKYIGLRFIIGANTHYGWAKLDVNDSTNWLIKEYAYNSTPDAPINAGQTVLGVDDKDLSKIKIVALNKSIGIYNLSESTNYTIYNMTGKVVLNGSTTQKDYVIEAPTLASGIYIVELKDPKSNATMKKKIVLQ